MTILNLSLLEAFKLLREFQRFLQMQEVIAIFIFTINQRLTIGYGLRDPALAFHPVTVFTGNHQCRTLDFPGKHISPVVQNVIEQNVLKRSHIRWYKFFSKFV